MKQYQIVAITTLFGNTIVDNVVNNVILTLKIMNANSIPVYRGAHSSLVSESLTDSYFGKDGLSNASYFYETSHGQLQSEHAVNALVRLVKQFPERITILCMGPLTNIALAFLMEPNFFRLTKHIYILGGNVNAVGNVKPTAEFNFFLDPEATRVVLKNAVCPVTIVPWETLKTHPLSWESYKKLTDLNTKKSVFFQQITKVLFDRKDPALNGFGGGDFLLAATFFYPKIILGTERWMIDIELNGFLTRGQLVVDKRVVLPKGFIFVVKLNTEMLFYLYYRTLIH
ncbi:inosine-uridine preferring nucleoside hydrolase-like protein [Leptotrombidium deliense]|uniref:Inosine-uridine preferring nucleoside hydrolase-like protein n=1 Tax=Leptotrombidium deliense TaxID=299467 RepID=A0A443SSF1_9ACAR|nr:inosine-uridine preferring nucleoside hydrolase-like protein [Leptotrombidium deliense]